MKQGDGSRNLKEFVGEIPSQRCCPKRHLHPNQLLSATQSDLKGEFQCVDELGVDGRSLEYRKVRQTEAAIQNVTVGTFAPDSDDLDINAIIYFRLESKTLGHPHHQHVRSKSTLQLLHEICRSPEH